MARLQGLMNLQNRLSACRVCRTHLAVPAILAVAPKTPFQLPPGYRECTNETEISTSRPLTKFTSGVLAALRGSTYGGEYASPLRLLRPCWTPLLNSLRLLLNESVSIRVSQGVHAYHHKRSASTLTPIIREKVKPDSFVYKTVYAGLDVSEYHHRHVNRSKMFVSTRGHHINDVENFYIKPNGMYAASTASLRTAFTGYQKSATSVSTVADLTPCYIGSNLGIVPPSTTRRYFNPCCCSHETV